jgi:hypothetical protein
LQLAPLTRHGKLGRQYLEIQTNPAVVWCNAWFRVAIQIRLAVAILVEASAVWLIARGLCGGASDWCALGDRLFRLS